MKKQPAIIAAISLLIGLGGGFIIGRAYTLSTHTHDTAITGGNSESHQSSSDHSHGASDGEHTHEAIEVSGDKAPTVLLKVTKDAKSGWHVHLDTTNYRFAPEHANQENVVGEGHGHLYVDGKMVSRLYGPDYHYNENFTGERTFKVTLNGNSHVEYKVDGKPVAAEVTVKGE
jgi:Fe-S cluster assembly iron-binding protein IscA